MADIFFISSKQGKIIETKIYKYVFSKDLSRQEEKKALFCKWLINNPEIIPYEINKHFFTTLLPIQEKKNWQYYLDSVQKIEPPFLNTQQVSSFLGHYIRKCFNNYNEQFLNENIFAYDLINLPPFHLLKCFQFNVEVFLDGEFFIHFLPVSKITSSKDIDLQFIKSLKKNNQNNTNPDALDFFLVETIRFKRKKVNLLNRNYIQEIEKFLNKNERVIATFDYHFLANYSPEIFGKITQNTVKDLNKSIDSIIEFSKLIDLPENFELHNKPFFKISINKPTIEKNLIIGNNTKTKKPSTAYYNGVFKPVIEKAIQPIAFDGIDPELFYELIERFNKGGSLKILKTIFLPSNSVLDTSILKDAKNAYKSALLLAVFTKYEQPSEFFQPLIKSGIKFQLYQGNIDQFKLSNFAVKCIEKLGGLLSSIDNTFEPETTYFIGIDLGHNRADRYSNLSVVFFDHKGKWIFKKGIERIPLNEALDMNALGQAFYPFIDFIKMENLPVPKKFIVHRDGKNHQQDYECYEMIFKKGLKISEYDIVEIIKSGFPIIAKHDGKNYKNLDSGDFWILKEKKYAILATNIQADENDALLKPIIIKHKYGESDFEKIVEQVYWFTKVYTNNLYNSTRLPATTERANNLAGSGNKRFISTYRA